MISNYYDPYYSHDEKREWVDKACEWLEKELFTRYNGCEYRVASNRCVNLQQFIEDFRKELNVDK
jgi:hypothetical protein